MATKTILQIIPADGWFAVYSESFSDGARGEIALRFPCWALFEETKDGKSYRYVQGLYVGADGGYDSVEDASNFERYVHIDDAEWICKQCGGLGDCDHKQPSDSVNFNKLYT